MRFSSILRVIALTVVTIAFALALSTCGGSHRVAPPDQVYPPFQAVIDPSLDSTLAELAALETPDGVDAELFAELKSALREALDQRFSPLTPNPSSLTPAKLVSTPPTGDANRVTDLAITDNGGGNYTLSWHYQNAGDYDQNGTIGISDITPIAMHYGETYDIEDVNCLLAVIDGSGNGVVDIADITPIAMNYGVDCAGYRIEGADTVEGPFTEVDTVDYNVMVPTERKHFTYDLSGLEYEYYQVVSYDSEGAEGIPSNVISATEPPSVISIAPITGATGSELTIVAVVTGARPLVYAWDFGGGAEPGTSNEETPIVTLGDVGNYDAILTVANNFGLDEYDFTLTVGLPPDIVGVGPQHGSPGNVVSFVAVAYGTQPFTYSWDFGGGATPNTSDNPQPQVILGPGGKYAASVTISNDYGVDTFDFTLLVGVPHIWHVTPTVGATGHAVVFAAMVLGDEPLTYEWDFGGGADPNNSSEVSPEVVLGEVGEYNASLTLTNEYGSDEYDFMLQCGNLPEIVGVTPAEGETGIETTFEAEVNGTPPFEYEWNFGGAAEPNESNEEQPTVLMLDMGDYEVSITVTDLFGSDTYAFPFHVGGWHLVIVDDIGGSTIPSPVSLSLVNGNPAISYVQGHDLTFVRSTNAQGTAWNEPITVAPGSYYYPSLTVINGKPAIGYGGYYALNYVRAIDASGDAWGDPVTVDNTPGTSVTSVSLCAVNGNPAICYTDWNNWEVKYVRAQDQDGDLWGEPQIVAGNSPWSCSLAVVNGNPAISYHERIGSENGRLRYTRALDVDGSMWGESIIVDNEGDTGMQPSLTLVCGNPAVCYIGTYESRCLKYVRSLDENGSAWAVPVIASDAGGGWSSLAVVNGIPCVSYADLHAVLGFVAAADSEGVEWRPPVWVDYNKGMCTSLIELNGRPAIGYFDDSNNDIKFAWYY